MFFRFFTTFSLSLKVLHEFLVFLGWLDGKFGICFDVCFCWFLLVGVLII